MMRLNKVNKYKYYTKNLFENWTNNKETCSISLWGWRLQGGILLEFESARSNLVDYVMLYD
jgi:hypothetical protein